MDNAQLLEAVNQAVLDKTMSLEGLKAIGELKSQLALLEGKVKSRSEALEDRDRQLKQAHEMVAGLQKSLEKAEAELKDLRARESAVTEALLAAKYSDLRRQDVMDVVKTVFRSPVFTKTISECGSTPVKRSYGSGGGDYIESHTTSKTTTETTEEK